jgi:hypothetical protein
MQHDWQSSAEKQKGHFDEVAFSGFWLPDLEAEL